MPILNEHSKFVQGERSGIVAEHLTQYREVLGSIPTGGTVLCL